MACAIVCCMIVSTLLHSLFIAKVINVIAPSSYCYCTIAVNKCAVTAASRRSTIADLALTTTCPPEPCISWSRLAHILPCHTPTPIVWLLVCATARPVLSPSKATAILNESVTAVIASRWSYCTASNLFSEKPHCTRAGQDQGGPRWDTLTKNSKSTN